MESIIQGLAENWDVWFVTVVLIVAAVIDGAILKVPNWLTFPFIICGWVHCTLQAGWAGLGFSLLGTFVGMMLLLVLRNVGGMGGGDVKLLAGVGAWLGTVVTLYAFAATAIVGVVRRPRCEGYAQTRRACVRREQAGERAILLSSGALPLLAIPWIYALRPRGVTPELSLSRDDVFVGLNGSF